MVAKIADKQKRMTLAMALGFVTNCVQCNTLFSSFAEKGQEGDSTRMFFALNSVKITNGA